MKVNRKTVLSTAAVLGVAALVAGGTIAYFTDNDTATNTFTVGNVDVTLYESQLHRVNANVGSYFQSDIAAASADDFHVCVPYIQGGQSVVNPYCTPNIAVSTDLSDVSAWRNGHVRAQNVAGVTGAGQRGVYSDAQIIEDSESTAQATATNPGGYADYKADEYGNLVPGKQVRKFVYVKNTGTNPVYARVKVTIPASVAGLVTVKAPHTPQESCAPVTGNSGACISGAANQNIDGVDFSDHKYITQLADTTNANGDTVMTFVYTDALKANEMTYWSPITTVSINKDVMESELTNIAELHTTGFGVIVDVDAIQSEGFADVTAAFNEFDNKTVGQSDNYEGEVNQ